MKIAPNSTARISILTVQPTRCPYEECLAAGSESAPFYVKWGHYEVSCRERPVARFRCRSCERTFSTQTYRADFRQLRPDINSQLLRLLVSGVGFRQSARMLEVARDTVTRHFEKLAHHCRKLHDQIAQSIQGLRQLQFDEMITFETCRLSMPVTMGTLIESDSRFILEQANGAIKPGGKKSARAERLIRKHAALSGQRSDESKACVRKIFSRGCSRLAGTAQVTLTTDGKSTYGPLAREAFGERLVAHVQHPGTAARGPGTTLHPINHTQAMWRDNLSRLRRRSWLASKRRECLELHGHLFVVYRNYIRPRFNGETRTPGQRLGLTHRAWTFEDVVGWVPPTATGS